MLFGLNLCRSYVSLLSHGLTHVMVSACGRCCLHFAVCRTTSVSTCTSQVLSRLLRVSYDSGRHQRLTIHTFGFCVGANSQGQTTSVLRRVHPVISGNVLTSDRLACSVIFHHQRSGVSRVRTVLSAGSLKLHKGLCLLLSCRCRDDKGGNRTHECHGLRGRLESTREPPAVGRGTHWALVVR